MRKVIYHLLLITVIISLSCRKESELEKLPSATQVGAGTFGCLIDGIAFKPKGNPLGGPVKNCAYQYIDGGYYFQLSAKNRNDILRSISIHTDSLPIQEGQTLVLEDVYKKGAASATYFFSENFSLDRFLTTELKTGELKITKLDLMNRIVSGTFWFDAVNKNGQVVKIREGRFDVRFSL